MSVPSVPADPVRHSEAPIGHARRDIGQALIGGLALFVGLGLLVAGVWALGWPRQFAELVRFDYHEHFLHDAGAFQIGLGVGLLVALIWRDAMATALLAVLVANSVHAYNHAVDLHLGGRASDPWLLGAVSVLLAAALWVRARQLGFVLGRVRPATTPALVPFVEQKTVVLATRRRDGSPVPTAVSLAVAGDRAVFRGYERAGKTRRLRRDASAELAPATWRGVPTGPAITCTARRLHGAEARRAARLLAAKYPLLHGVVVPLLHRLGRAKLGRTVYFELTPIPGATPG
jgi:PPOX class probable F420-dependent enzyme